MSIAADGVRRGPTERVKRSHEETYRNYRVIGGRQGNWNMAVAYEGPTRAFAATCEGLEEAIAEVKSRIDRKFDENGSVAERSLGCSDFVTGLNLTIARRTGAERHLLERIARLDETTFTPAQLRGHSEFDDASLNRGIVQLGRRIARALEIRLPAGAENAVAARRILLQRDTPEAGEIIFREQFVTAAKDHLGL